MSVLIQPFSLNDAEELQKAAQRDGHGVAAPTHIVVKERNIIGYLSLAVVPTVLLWLDSEHCLVRDSIQVVNFYEEYMARHKQPGFLLPVPKDSPMQPYVEKVGYQLASPNTMIYFKNLNDGHKNTINKEGK